MKVETLNYVSELYMNIFGHIWTILKLFELGGHFGVFVTLQHHQIGSAKELICIVFPT